MYNTKDLIVMLEEMSSTMNNLVDKVRRGWWNGFGISQWTSLLKRLHGCVPPQEIQHAYHTNALLIKMLLAQAQAQGVELLVDTNALENEFLLKQVTSHGKPNA